jgi:hypothetical protein
MHCLLNEDNEVFACDTIGVRNRTAVILINLDRNMVYWIICTQPILKTLNIK